jgi:hypothetical protein
MTFQKMRGSCHNSPFLRASGNSWRECRWLTDLIFARVPPGFPGISEMISARPCLMSSSRSVFSIISRCGIVVSCTRRNDAFTAYPPLLLDFIRCSSRTRSIALVRGISPLSESNRVKVVFFRVIPRLTRLGVCMILPWLPKKHIQLLNTFYV